LIEVEIAETLGRLFRVGDLAVVEDDPATLLQDVADVVADHVRRAHVRDEGHLKMFQVNEVKP